MMELSVAESLESTAAQLNEIRTQLTQVMRYGIQRVTPIADTGSRERGFENLTLLNKDGRRGGDDLFGPQAELNLQY